MSWLFLVAIEYLESLLIAQIDFCFSFLIRSEKFIKSEMNDSLIVMNFDN